VSGEGLFWNGPVEPPKAKVRFVILDLEALAKNVPRNSANNVDPATRKAILASIIKSNLTAALNTAETCYYKATQAYQFGPSSYTHAALVSCINAKATLNEMLAELSS
jgi:hypothetical protein